MSLPPIDARTAVRVGRRAVPAGPDLAPGELADVVAGLRRAATASLAPVAEVTRLTLPPDADPDAAVIDRGTWVEANVTMALRMLAEATGAPLPAPATLRERAAAHANGAQLGAALAVFGVRILGQYLPFSPRPRLVVVAPNIVKVERALGVVPADFRLWVLLHERTHHLQFAHAPWLRGHLASRVGEVAAADDDPAPARPRHRPTSLVDVVTTPRQREVFEEVGATMALLEGHAEVMMDRVGPAVVPTVSDIRARFERHRRRGGMTRVLGRALGMDVKLAQYAEGAAFCRAVIDRVGVDGLNAAFDAPAQLPSAAEIREPARWVGRVHG